MLWFHRDDINRCSLNYITHVSHEALKLTVNPTPYLHPLFFHSRKKIHTSTSVDYSNQGTSALFHRDISTSPCTERANEDHERRSNVFAAVITSTHVRHSSCQSKRRTDKSREQQKKKTESRCEIAAANSNRTSATSFSRNFTCFAHGSTARTSILLDYWATSIAINSRKQKIRRAIHYHWKIPIMTIRR